MSLMNSPNQTDSISPKTQVELDMEKGNALTQLNAASALLQLLSLESLITARGTVGARILARKLKNYKYYGLVRAVLGLHSV